MATAGRWGRGMASSSSPTGDGGSSFQRLDPGLRRSLLRLQEVSASGAPPRALDLAEATSALNAWQGALGTGLVPRGGGGDEGGSGGQGGVTLPREPLRSLWTQTLLELDMPRFTRRHPILLGICLQNMLDLAISFELAQQDLAAAQEGDQTQEEELGSNEGEIGGSGTGEGGDGENSMPGSDEGEGSDNGERRDDDQQQEGGQAGGSEARVDGQPSSAEDWGDEAEGGGGGAEQEDEGRSESAGSGGGGRGEVSLPQWEELLEGGHQELTLAMDEQVRVSWRQLLCAGAGDGRASRGAP